MLCNKIKVWKKTIQVLRSVVKQNKSAKENMTSVEKCCETK